MRDSPALHRVGAHGGGARSPQIQEKGEMMDRITAKQRILEVLRGGPLAVHEMGLPSVSQNSAATRCAELQKAGLIIGEKLGGKPYKTWRLLAGPEMEKVA